MDLMGQHAQREGPDRAPPIDCYGNGEDLQAVAAASEAKRLPLTFHGAKDHLDDSMHEYKVRALLLGSHGANSTDKYNLHNVDTVACVMCECTPLCR